jgi:hypothetical protein
MNRQSAEQIQQVKDRLEKSPLKDLIEPFQASPFNFAPERQAELEELMKQLGFSLMLIWPGNGLRFYVVPPERQIYFHLCGLERLWAYAYGYTATLDLLGTMPRGQTFTRSPEVTKLLHWAHTSAESANELPWPDGCPRPDRAGGDPLMPVVREVFLCMNAWILLHEVAHIVRNDGDYDLSPTGHVFNHAMEENADDWATRFALAFWRSYQDDPRLLVKRGVGVGFALFVLAAYEFFLGGSCVPSLTHPSPIRRVRNYFQYLDRTFGANFPTEVLKIQDAVVSLLFGVMSFGRSPSDLALEHETVADCLDYVEANFRPIPL